MSRTGKTNGTRFFFSLKGDQMKEREAKTSLKKVGTFVAQRALLQRFCNLEESLFRT